MIGFLPKLFCTLTLSNFRFITIFASGSATSGKSFDLKTLRSIRVLRPLKLVNGIPSMYMVENATDQRSIAPINVSLCTIHLSHTLCIHDLYCIWFQVFLYIYLLIILLYLNIIVTLYRLPLCVQFNCLGNISCSATL